MYQDDIITSVIAQHERVILAKAKTFTTSKTSAKILPIIDKQLLLARAGQQAPYRFYLISLKQLLGEGGEAKIYSAYQLNIDFKSGELKLGLPYVAKIPTHPITSVAQRRLLAQQAYLFAQHYQAEVPLYDEKNSAYLLLQRLPGQDLLTLLNADDDPIFYLSFQHKIILLAQLADQLNLCHHHTPRTGAAIAYLDLSPENLLIELAPLESSKAIKSTTAQRWIPLVRLIDFGNALPLTDTKHQSPGKLIYAAPEVLRYTGFSDKSDIYSFTALFGFILDAVNPAEEKGKIADEIDFSLDREIIKVQMEKLAKTPFSFDDMAGTLKKISGFPFVFTEPKPTEDPLVARLIAVLWQRLQADYLEHRPSAHELLRFLLTLHNLTLYLQTTKKSQRTKATQYAYLAKLTVLAYGLWQTPLGNYAINNECLAPTFECHDFADSPRLNKFIVNNLPQSTVKICTENFQQNFYSAFNELKLKKLAVNSNNLKVQFRLYALLKNLKRQGSCTDQTEASIKNENNNAATLKDHLDQYVNELLKKTKTDIQAATELLNFLDENADLLAQTDWQDYKERLNKALRRKLYTYQVNQAKANEENQQKFTAFIATNHRTLLRLSQPLASPTVEQCYQSLIAYQQQINVLIKQYGTDYHQKSFFGLIKFGYSVGEKKAAAENLMTYYALGKTTTLFKNKQNLAALNNGKLANIARPLLAGLAR